jgi:hypothetical protein
MKYSERLKGQILAVLKNENVKELTEENIKKAFADTCMPNKLSSICIDMVKKGIVK